VTQCHKAKAERAVSWTFAYRLIVHPRPIVHPGRLSRALLIGAVCAALVAGLGAAGRGASPMAQLTLDGKPFRPELALTGAKRQTGLMHRTRAPVNGMLFVFPGNTNGGFWMKDTLVPLTIVFFDQNGKRVRRMLMSPCKEGPCPTYIPGRWYRFALELAASDTRPANRLGPPRELRRLARIAR
jgi:uncharacterized membrane protein (UPF0127 family)